MRKVAISQSNYIPWKGYFDNVHMVDTFVLYDDAQYTKRDWRNRNRIKTKDGVQWLTIPVEVKGKFHQTIRETRISDSGWASRHWKTVQSNYGKAPYFKQFEDYFASLYDRASHLEFLSDVNSLFLQELCKTLGIVTEWKWSSEFQPGGDATEKLVNICRQLGATDYYSGPLARNYMDESLFSSANIRLHYFDYSGYPEYTQLFGEFVHEVSIIDLLFNEGPNASKYMKSFSRV